MSEPDRFPSTMIKTYYNPYSKTVWDNIIEERKEKAQKAANKAEKTFNKLRQKRKVKNIKKYKR